MAEKKSTTETERINDDAMPSVVDGILVFFYFVVWIDIVGVTLAVLDGDFSRLTRYGAPLLLYAALLLSFPVRNWKRFRSGEGKVSDLVWGYHCQYVHNIVFVLSSFALVFWLSALNDNFVNLYFMLLAVSAGLLSRRWKIMGPLVAAEFLAFATQSGIWEEWQKSGYNIFSGAIVGFTLGSALFVVYMVMVTVLISSRVKSEALVIELRKTKTQLEEALRTEKEVGVLRERTRMAREMHDGLGHALVLVAVKIEAAQRLQAVDPQRASAELDATKELVRQSMADLRASLADLRSPNFEAGSKPLDQAIREWATRTAIEGKFAIRCNIEADTDKLPLPVQDALWMVGREAVYNVVKHARAHSVELNLFIKSNQAILTVTDDGVGIPHLADGNARLEIDGHYGVRGMRERVEALGGHLQIKPGRQGQGTMVIATVPLPTINDKEAVADIPKSGESKLHTLPALGRQEKH